MMYCYRNGEHMRAARIIGLAKDEDNQVKRKYDPNPLKNTQVYEVMFPDGAVQ